MDDICIICRNPAKTTCTCNKNSSNLNQNLEAILEGHTFFVNTIAVTNDNKYIVSGANGGPIRIWSLLDKKQKGMIKGHTSFVNTIVITSDKKYIISGYCQTIRNLKFF